MYNSFTPVIIKTMLYDVWKFINNIIEICKKNRFRTVLYPNLNVFTNKEMLY